MIEAEYVRLDSGVGRQRRTVLDDVSLTIPDSSITTVLGGLDSDMSALMNVLGGMERVTSGSVVVDGVDLASTSDAERERMRASTFALLFKQDNLLPALTLGENLDLPAKLNGTRVSTQERTEIIDLFGLSQVLGHYPDAVPLIEQNKCALAALVMAGRRVVLCDEPTDGFTRADRETLYALLRVCARERGMTVVTFTSNPMSAVSADRVYLMTDSRITAELNAPTLDSILDTLRVIFSEEP
ncbi:MULTISPECIES: ATP-binding cassette domain-containing protein [Trueperella]|uniref:ATP-binding cassette domain-containing protein n=1 Tax=Trueperella bernardiae TaxID=59561 RepID=A0AAW6ZKC1_9ACTO|nr:MULTISPECIES: ATP-binding cassette domain-containing protein [Trueperella]MCM3906863.1 ATP-binding cassette domain-containing protein [Trueperella bernardiae]MDK8602216.1 ATP-binding cassette domain-containing protein [Trueperella bernardiae]MDV6238742.1 ATP-binding cassette domain-containing protein [Trueperella bernardiae]OCW60819.1 hypothetical protein AKG36_04020 [Trueperella bernardiae]OFS66763.1 hypothetical protein HMPREF3174_05620 [Trueperella sp. HMSC08H06]